MFGPPQWRQAKVRRAVPGDKLLELIKADELLAAGCADGGERAAVLKAVGHLWYPTTQPLLHARREVLNIPILPYHCSMR